MAETSLTSAYAYRWKEPSRPMLNVYHYRSRYGVDNPQFGIVGFETKKSSQPGPARGTLGRLPTEILYNIFLNLDIFSLEMVRELNAYYKRVLDGLYEFRVLKQHASETFRIMYAVRINHIWTLSQIFAEFTHSRCRTCDNFGPYIFLLTFSRCCYKCLLDHEDYELAPAADLSVYYMFPNWKLGKHIPVLDSLPNDYGAYDSHSHFKTCQMASVQAASGLSLSLYGDTETLQRLKGKRKTISLKKYNDALRVLVSWHSARLLGNFPSPGTPVRPPCLKFKCFDKKTLSKWRFMASTAFPYWDIAKEKLEPGAYCSACTAEWEDLDEPLDHYERNVLEKRYHQAFTEQELPIHFSQCEATWLGFVRENCTREHFPVKRSGENFLVELKEEEPSVGPEDDG